MTQHDWPISKSTGHCARSGRALAEGEEFFSAIVQDGNELRRLDFSVTEWTGPPDGTLCHFRTRVPAKSKPKKLFVDEAVLFDFFERLRDDSDAGRVRFRFVLALMLMRKRLLRYEGSERTEHGETWTLFAPRDQSKHLVVNPNLTDDEATQASQQLSALLGGDAISSAEIDPPISTQSAAEFGGMDEPS